MTILSHRGYQGSVEYEDGTLYIQLLHINDTVIGECKSAADVCKVFEDLVDDYLQTCRSVGKEPDKPFSGTFNVRVGPDLHKAASYSASRGGLTLNAWVSEAMSKHLDAKKMKRQFDHAWIVLGQKARLTHTEFERWPEKTGRVPVLPQSVHLKARWLQKNVSVHLGSEQYGSKKQN